MKIGIISLGLIGGSIFKALTEKGFDVYACTRNAKAIESAKAFCKNVSNEINIVKNCNIVFVCSPMSKTLEVLDKLEAIVSENTIVTDVCSLKEFVTEKRRPYKFIGSHPMAGTENSGFDFADTKLFEGAKWVLTPNESTDKKALEQLKSIIETTGAHTVVTDAKAHDKAVALISHMPMVIAQALMKTAMQDEDKELTLTLAASGFRDMTRLALSNTQMAQDMVKMNSHNVSETLITLMKNSIDLLKDDYSTQIENIKNERSNLYNKDGKNIYN